MSSSAIFDKDVLLAMIIGLLGIYILHVDSSTPAVNNYGEPIKISATEEKDIIIELVSNPTSLSKYSNEHTIISFLSLTSLFAFLIIYLLKYYLLFILSQFFNIIYTFQIIFLCYN